MTPLGLKTALFYSSTYQRVIRPGLSFLEARLSYSERIPDTFPT